MDRSSSGRSQKLRGKIAAQTRSTNDLIAPISAATSKSAGIQILPAYAPECCISSESFPAPPDVPGITGLVAGNRFMEIYFNLTFRSMTGVTDRALPVLYYVVKTVALDIDEVIPDAIGNFPNPSPITVTGLTNGRRYKFTLYAVNALGLSNSGSTATAGGPSALIGVPAGPPSAPTDVSATVVNNIENSIITVTGTVVDNGGSAITRYILKRYTDTGSYISPDLSQNSLPFTIETTVHASYKYKLIAINDVSGSDESAFSNPVTVLRIPGTPVITSVSRSGQNVTVNFTSPSDGGSPITKYTVNTFDLDGNYVDGYLVEGAGSPLTVTGLLNDRSYKFTVFSTNSIGPSDSSAFSDPITIPSAGSVPDPPVLTSVTRGDGQLTVSYTAPASNGGSTITGYKYSTNNGTSYTLTSDIDGSLTISPLSNGTTYNIIMKAVNSVGDSAASNMLPGIPSSLAASVPTAPLLLRTLADNGQAYIYFAPQNNGGSTILKYKYSIDGGASYTDYTLGDIISPLLITTGLTNGVTYTVRLKAVNSVGESAESNTMTVTPTNTSTAATATLWLDPTDTTTYTRSGTVITAAKLKTDASTVNSTSVGSGITYDSASAGGVFDFNGGGGAVINFPAYDFGSTITVTAWINPRVKHSINGLIANGTAWGAGTSGQGFRFQWNWWVSPATSSSRTIQSQLGALLTPSTSNLDDDHSPTDIIQYNVWQHVGYQLDTINNTIIFFYNGVPTLITTDGRTPSPITMAGLPFVIGGLRGGSYTMNAKLGDLKVFNTLLDAKQVTAEFDATKARFGL